MSSSSTETTLVDVTMPQMGVSVAEGTVVEWKKQVGDWVQADEIIASISTDKIDTDVEAPATGRVQEVLVDVGTTVDVGTVLARIATDAKPGEAHRSESDSSRAARARPPPRWRPPARRASSRATRPCARARSDGPRRYSPVVMRIAVRARDRPRAGRGHRPRRPRAQAGRAGVPGERRRAGRAADAHREPVPARRAGAGEDAQAALRGARPPSRRRRRPGSAPLSRMRQAIGARMLAVAADRGDVHDRRRGRPDPHRGGAQADRASRTCRTSRARRSRRCASSRRSTPRSRTTR